MNIETKFKVGSLVRHKFERQTHDAIHALEVMEISTDTCYAGTQVFYQCRALVAQKQFKNEYAKTGDFTWALGHTLLPWFKYREDELVEIPKNEADFFTGAVADLV